MRAITGSYYAHNGYVVLHTDAVPGAVALVFRYRPGSADMTMTMVDSHPSAEAAIAWVDAQTPVDA
jgi:hypothetical protein